MQAKIKPDEYFRKWTDGFNILSSDVISNLLYRKRCESFFSGLYTSLLDTRANNSLDSLQSNICLNPNLKE